MKKNNAKKKLQPTLLAVKATVYENDRTQLHDLFFNFGR